jgi:hypothetical protein
LTLYQSIRTRLEGQITKLKNRFGQVNDLPLGEVLATDVVAQAVEEEVGAHRQRVFTPLVTLTTFIGQVLDADHSCRNAVAQVIAEQVAAGEEPCSSATGAYCKARQRLPEELLWRLMRESGQALEGQAEGEWKWKGRAVKLVDGTTVSMPDTGANQEAYRQPSGQAPGLGFPQARLVGLIGLSTGAVEQMAIGACQGKQTGEHGLLRQVLGNLVDGDVLLGDGYYRSYWLLAQLQAQGADGVFELHHRRLSGLSRWQKQTQVVWVKPKQRPEWMDEGTYQRLPKSLTVRVIRSRKKLLVTTLLDTKRYSRQAIGKLYTQRWHVEVDLRFIKEVLQMDVLRGKTPAMVRKEIAVHLLAYNLIRTVIAQAAQRHARAPRTLSFKAALQLLSAFQDKGLLDTEASCRACYEPLLCSIIGHRIGNRPGRAEPRAVKRRPKKHPLLTKPRQQARAELFPEVQYA